jgi:hypothetical protein
MDDWGWEQLRPWLTARAELPVGPLFCIIAGPTRGRRWSGAAVRSQLHRLAARGRPASLRAPSAAPRTRTRARPRGRAAQHHPAAIGAYPPRYHQHLAAGNRPRGDHRRSPRPQGADDVGQRRAQALTRATAASSGSADLALPLSHGEASAWTRPAESSGGRPRQARPHRSGALSLPRECGRRRAATRASLTR